jgi:hypothetical protein
MHYKPLALNKTRYSFIGELCSIFVLFCRNHFYSTMAIVTRTFTRVEYEEDSSYKSFYISGSDGFQKLLTCYDRCLPREYLVHEHSVHFSIAISAGIGDNGQ